MKSSGLAVQKFVSENTYLKKSMHDKGTGICLKVLVGDFLSSHLFSSPST